MTSKLTITDERLAELVAFKPLPGTDINSATRDEWMAMAAELHERRKAERDSESVAWQYRVSAGPATGWSLWHDGKGEQYENSYKVERRPLYRHAQPAPERDQVRREHAEWSQATFGNVGPVGPLKHLSKEALEAAAEPDDLSEWADMQFLLWDAQRRAGITDDQITQSMIEKLAVNKQREWPEPKDGEPRLHIKEQPAPAIPDFETVLESLDYDVRCNIRESEHVYQGSKATYDACRAAMLNHPSSIQTNTDAAPGAEIKHPSSNSPVIGIDLATGPDRTVEVRYVAPPGYVMVPKEPTKAMILSAMRDNETGEVAEIYDLMLAAAPQEVPDGK